MDDPISETIKDWFVSQLPPEVKRLLRQHKDNSNRYAEQQRAEALQRELSETKALLESTRQSLDKTISSAAERIEELTKESKRSKIWMWVGLGVGVIGVLLAVYQIFLI